MVRKRYTELVVGISKGAPQALTLFDIVIGMGQQKPAKAESRKVITYFLKSTVSGLLSEKCEFCWTKQHTWEKRQQNRGEKTDCTFY